MKSELGAKELPASLNAFISLSIRVDYHMQKNSIRGRTTNPRGLRVGQLTGPAPFPWRKCSVENSPCSCLSIPPAHWGRWVLVLWQKIYEAPGTPLVFGHLWLSKYNLHIDQVQNTIAGSSGQPTISFAPGSQYFARSPVWTTGSVLSACHDLANIFHKDLALYSPHHRPYARATDLPGAPLSPADCTVCPSWW